MDFPTPEEAFQKMKINAASREKARKVERMKKIMTKVCNSGCFDQYVTVSIEVDNKEDLICLLSQFEKAGLHVMTDPCPYRASDRQTCEQVQDPTVYDNKDFAVGRAFSTKIANPMFGDKENEVVVCEDDPSEFQVVMRDGEVDMEGSVALARRRRLWILKETAKHFHVDVINALESATAPQFWFPCRGDVSSLVAPMECDLLEKAHYKVHRTDKVEVRACDGVSQRSLDCFTILLE